MKYSYTLLEEKYISCLIEQKNKILGPAIVVVEPADPAVPGSKDKLGLKFGKYTLFKAKYRQVQEQPYQDAINQNKISGASKKNLNQLQDIGFNLTTYYESGNGWGVYGTDPNGEEMVYARKSGQTPVLIYYRNRYFKAWEVIPTFQQRSGKITFTTEEFLDYVVMPEWVTDPSHPKGGKKVKKWTVRPDGRVDVQGSVILDDEIRTRLLRYPLTSDTIPVKFGIIEGYLRIDLYVDPIKADWLPEKVKGNVYLNNRSNLSPLNIYRMGKTNMAPQITYKGFNLPTDHFDQTILTPDSDYYKEIAAVDDIQQRATAATKGKWNFRGGITENVDFSLGSPEDVNRIYNTVKSWPQGDEFIVYLVEVEEYRGELFGETWPTHDRFKIWIDQQLENLSYDRSISNPVRLILMDFRHTYDRWLDQKKAKEIQKRASDKTKGRWNFGGSITS